MGGYFSTRWNDHVRKLTVEECLNLSIFELKRDQLLNTVRDPVPTDAEWLRADRESRLCFPQLCSRIHPSLRKCTVL